jgi:hypothetical protein
LKRGYPISGIHYFGRNKDGTATLEFYSSDLHGKYMVLVQGMNEKGDFVSATTIVEVK